MRMWACMYLRVCVCILVFKHNCAYAHASIISSVYEKYKCIIVTCVEITDLCMYQSNNNNKLN